MVPRGLASTIANEESQATASVKTLSRQLAWHPRFAEQNEWLWPVAQVARALSGCATWPALGELDRLYARVAREQRLPALRFCADSATAAAKRGRRRSSAASPKNPLSDAYDTRVAQRGEVPTRPNNWHDLLNALCFAAWPHSKRALHERQHDALVARPAGRAHARGAERDALTLFDEGGVILASADERTSRVREALHAGAWQVLRELERTRTVRIVLFGHALLEHLLAGLPCPAGSARIVDLTVLPPDDQSLLGTLDRSLAGALRDPRCFRAPSQTPRLALAELCT